MASISNKPICILRNLHLFEEYAFQLSAKVCDIIKSDRVCVTVGGDHSIGLGTVYGHAKAYPEEVKELVL